MRVHAKDATGRWTLCGMYGSYAVEGDPRPITCGHCIKKLEGRPLGAGGLSQKLRVARFVADHWRKAMASSPGTSFAAHPLCMVLAALDGETDPLECGIDFEAHDAFRAAVNGGASGDERATREREEPNA